MHEIHIIYSQSYLACAKIEQTYSKAPILQHSFMQRNTIMIARLTYDACFLSLFLVCIFHHVKTCSPLIVEFLLAKLLAMTDSNKCM